MEIVINTKKLKDIKIGGCFRLKDDIKINRLYMKSDCFYEWDEEIGEICPVYICMEIRNGEYAEFSEDLDIVEVEVEVKIVYKNNMT